MALQRQSKSLIFSQGIDTKTNPDLIPIGKLHSLENARINQVGKLSKKYGSTAFPTTKGIVMQDAAGGNIGAAVSGFTHEGGLYGIFPNDISGASSDSRVNGAPEEIYTYSPTAQTWNFVSKSANCIAESNVMAATDIYGSNVLINGDKGFSDCVVVNNTLYAVNNGDATDNTKTYITVIDLATKEVVMSQSITLAYARCVTFNSKVYFIGFLTTNTLKAFYIDPAISLAVGSFTFITDLHTDLLWDCFVAPVNGNLYLAYKNSGSGHITTNQYTTLPTSGTASIAATTATAETPVNFVTAFGGESTFNKVYVSYCISAPALRVAICPLNLASNSIVNVRNVLYASASGSTAPDRNGNYVLLSAQTPSGGFALEIDSFGLTASAVTSLVSGIGSFQNMILASKIATYNGWHYAVFTNNDPLERTYYLASLQQNSSTTDTFSQWIPVAKLLLGQGSESPFNGLSIGIMPQLFNDGAGNLYVVLNKFAFTTDGSVSYYSPIWCKFKFTDTNRYQTKEIGGLTYLTGGLPMVFDGHSFFEASFVHSPQLTDPPAGIALGGAGHLTLLGTYQMCTVFQFIDAKGNRHLSAPSIPVSVTLVSSQNGITLTIIPPGLSFHKDIDCLVYRTESAGTLFYLDKTYRINAGTISTVASLSQSDTDLITHELLYTTGNVIENQCPTSTRALTVWKDRLWALTDDGVVYSKAITDGFPAEFNPLFSLNIFVNKGLPKAIAALRDKLLVFFQDDVYYTSGDGPDDTGTVGSFTPLELACAGVGAVNALDVIECQDHVKFRSRDGWRMITQALQVVYIGAELQNYINEASVTYSANYDDPLHETRISDGTNMYVYDMYAEQWMITTSWPDKKQFYWSGIGSGNKKFIRIRADNGQILYEDVSTYLDGGGFQGMVVRTGWISMDQFLGFERLYKVLLLGRYYTPHNLVVKVFYDYIPQVIETFTFNSSTGNFATYSDANIYQNDSYAGNGYPLEVVFRPAQQKCEAIRFEISDSYISGNGQSLELTGLNFILGVRNVDGKIRDAASAGGSGKGSFIP